MWTSFPNQYLKASITFESSHERSQSLASSKTFKLQTLTLEVEDWGDRRSLCSVVLIFLPLRDLVIMISPSCFLPCKYAYKLTLSWLGSCLSKWLKLSRFFRDKLACFCVFSSFSMQSSSPVHTCIVLLLLLQKFHLQRSMKKNFSSCIFHDVSFIQEQAQDFACQGLQLSS